MVFHKPPVNCSHTRPRRFFCIFMHQMRYELPLIALFGLSLFVLALVTQQAYYRFMPAEWFLDVTSASIPTTRIGDDMVFTFCRDTRSGNLKTTGVRTFFRVVDNEHETSDIKYEIRPDIEKRNGCQNLLIPPNKYPSKEGTYFMYTSIGFKVGGVYKEVDYQTAPFLLSSAQQDLSDELEQFRKELR